MKAEIEIPEDFVELVDWVLAMILVAKESLSGTDPLHPKWDMNDDAFHEEAKNVLEQIK